MTQFRVVVSNMAQVQSALNKRIALIDRASYVIVEESGKAIRKAAQAKFRGRPLGSVRKKGELGPKYKTKGVHVNKKTGAITSFAPINGRPTNRTGHLADSIQFETLHVAPGRWGVTVGPTMKYGRAVELGSPKWKTGNKFPYLQPGYEEALPYIQEVYRQTWNRALR
jgi:hypothetical protein